MSAEQETPWPQKILLAKPRGFCAGVVKAVNELQIIVDANRAQDPIATTYAFHKIIHNKSVIEGFEQQGVRFVDNIEDIPDNESVIYSAHGVSPQVRAQAQRKGLKEYDTTCPLVESPHRRARRLAAEGYTMFYIGHAGHDEAVGVLGEAPDQMILVETVEDIVKTRLENPDLEKIAYLTQTTLSKDDTAPITAALEQTYPGILPPPKSDICYATLNRQHAVKAAINEGAEIIAVVGSQTSSNSKRLAEVAISTGKSLNRQIRAFLVDEVAELDPKWFIGANIVGITAGASVPEDKFQEVVSWFKSRGSEVDELPLAEGARDESNIHFALLKIPQPV